jgi:hypothetical protein
LTSGGPKDSPPKAAVKAGHPAPHTRERSPPIEGFSSHDPPVAPSLTFSARAKPKCIISERINLDSKNEAPKCASGMQYYPPSFFVISHPRVGVFSAVFHHSARRLRYFDPGFGHAGIGGRRFPSFCRRLG